MDSDCTLKTFEHSEKTYHTEYFPIRSADQKTDCCCFGATDKTEEFRSDLLAKREATSSKRNFYGLQKNKINLKFLLKEHLNI